jgi:hypothetical protein
MVHHCVPAQGQSIDTRRTWGAQRGLIDQVVTEPGLGPWAQGFKTLKPSHEALQASLWAWLGPGFPGPAWPGSGLLSRAGTSLHQFIHHLLIPLYLCDLAVS